jgi:hypothetical protein
MEPTSQPTLRIVYRKPALFADAPIQLWTDEVRTLGIDRDAIEAPLDLSGRLGEDYCPKTAHRAAITD